MNRPRTAIATLAVLALAALGFAPGAMAADGVGLYGRTDDLVVTLFAFGVMVFFAVFVTVATLVQMRLEGRKERARSELERLRRP